MAHAADGIPAHHRTPPPASPPVASAPVLVLDQSVVALLLAMAFSRLEAPAVDESVCALLLGSTTVDSVTLATHLVPLSRPPSALLLIDSDVDSRAMSESEEDIWLDSNIAAATSAHPSQRLLAWARCVAPNHPPVPAARDLRRQRRLDSVCAVGGLLVSVVCGNKPSRFFPEVAATSQLHSSSLFACGSVTGLVPLVAPVHALRAFRCVAVHVSEDTANIEAEEVFLSTLEQPFIPPHQLRAANSMTVNAYKESISEFAHLRTLLPPKSDGHRDLNSLMLRFLTDTKRRIVSKDSVSTDSFSGFTDIGARIVADAGVKLRQGIEDQLMRLRCDYGKIMAANNGNEDAAPFDYVIQQVAPVYVASGAETATTASVTDLATGSNAVVSEDSLQNIPAASAKKVRKPRKDKGNKRAIGSVADIPSGIVTASGPDAVVGSPAHGGSTPNGGGASSSKRKQRKSAVTVAEDDGVSKDVAATNVGVDVSSPASAVHRAGDGSDTTNMTPVAPSHFEGTIENQEHNPLDHEMVVEGKISGDTTNDAEERGESQIPADSAQEVQHAEDVAMAEPAEVPSAPEVSVDPGISVEDGEVVDGEIDRMDVDARE
ncbi:hypothetical protein HDU83_008796 [Entophlyctis luteolus]|nr:hypothetical protein HDU83_008796 [Entophlyctis luteolus]